jgi:hypothetical protein
MELVRRLKEWRDRQSVTEVKAPDTPTLILRLYTIETELAGISEDVAAVTRRSERFRNAGDLAR